MIEELIVNGQIYLGKQGENQKRIVKFREPTLWNATIGNGTCELIHTRCGETEPYKVTLEYADDCVIWKICTFDTACSGKGECELRYIVDGVVVKSERYITSVLSLSEASGGEVPKDISDWAKEIIEAKERVEELCGNLSGGGLKKIGFTSDCDYIATETDGYTAFYNAITEASDGEAFMVMPGDYNGTQTLEIRKNLNFIGVGMPAIKFPIYIYGEGQEQYDGSDHTLIVPINVFSVSWSGFKFNNLTKVYMAQEYQGQTINSNFNADNCIFDYNTSDNYINLLGNFKNCVFDIITPNQAGYTYVYFGGMFYDASNEFIDCDIFLHAAYGNEMQAKGCNIYLLYNRGEYDGTYDYFDFENCNIYNPNNIQLGDQHNWYSRKNAKNCNVFGGNPFKIAENVDGCTMFSGTKI